VHAGHLFVRKPEVSFKTPTYIVGGSDYSLARQGGFILRVFLSALLVARNLNKKIEESGTMPLFMNAGTISGIRKDRIVPEDSFRLQSSVSLLPSSQ